MDISSDILAFQLILLGTYFMHNQKPQALRFQVSGFTNALQHIAVRPLLRRFPILVLHDVVPVAGVSFVFLVFNELVWRFFYDEPGESVVHWHGEDEALFVVVLHGR